VRLKGRRAWLRGEPCHAIMVMVVVGYFVGDVGLLKNW
jgi:hypothetical protein